MDNEIIERCCLALEQRFKNLIAEAAGMSFEETKVSLPNRKFWAAYTVTIIKSMREPTKKMLALGPEVQCWPEIIDHIIGDR